MNLKTDYLDDVLDTLQNQLRKYNMIQNDDGTVSFVDVTKYSQNGDNFGAKDINNTNVNINANTEKLTLVESAVGFTKKNLLNNNLSTQTVNGITYTVNADKSITVNGTATADSNIKIDVYAGKDGLEIGNKYILNGKPKDVNDGCSMYLINSTVNFKAEDFGDGAEFTFPNIDTLFFVILVNSGVTLNNVTFYPMIRYASIEDGTYEKYMEDLPTQILNVENDRKALIAHVSLTNRDILDVSLYSAYFSLLGTNSLTTNLPDNSATWIYSVGYALKRSNSIWITLYGHYTSGSPKIARNYHTNNKWTGWTIE